MSASEYPACIGPADRRPNAALRLFCFPYAGGAASVFRGWSAHTPPEVEVCPIELPGRGLRFGEPLVERWQPLIAELQRELAPLLDKPFAFYGHSVGAFLCYELARALRREQGLQPVAITVSGCGAPHWPDDEPPVHQLPDDEFSSKLKALNGTPEEILNSPELWQLLLPIVRADYTVHETYAYEQGEKLSCPLLACCGERDPLVSRERLEAWREHTSGEFRTQWFDGDHFFLHQIEPRFVRFVAEAGARALALQPHGD